MKLLERSEYLEHLRSAFGQVVLGSGFNVFIAGEAGIGKTALVREFLAELESPYLLLEGYCDSLYAARPLGPLFDIAPQMGELFVQLLKENPNRTQIFPAALEGIDNQSKPVILLIEDIHWADGATMDFVRFLSRRVRQVQCLFILTLRDNELPHAHPYTRLLGDLPPTDYQKLVLTPLSRKTVATLADAAGRSGDEVYHLTAGVPYYVSEVLASYHRGVPETVRDSI
jgi:predicted ATPase